MGLNLYQGEPIFRGIVDDCCEYLKPHLGRDLRDLLYPESADEKTAQISLQDTFFTQPSIFVIEYALSRFWQSLGIEPAMMAGHSIGEFVAATLAGVWELEDAPGIIALKGPPDAESPSWHDDGGEQQLRIGNENSPGDATDCFQQRAESMRRFGSGGGGRPIPKAT